ncbi:MAG: DUF131 domain-containing protein [Nitrososphaeria archaeon]
MSKNIATTLIVVGIALCFLGIILLFVGSFLIIDNVSTGGVIFIGPLPIIFGSGKYGYHLILVSLAITMLMIIISYLVLKRRVRNDE